MICNEFSLSYGITQVVQACAYALGVPVDIIRVKPTTTLTAPNNGMSGAGVTSETCVYVSILAP